MRVAFLTVAFGCLFAVGCKSEGGIEKYTPSANDARNALETALKSWKDGQAKPAKFTQGKVNVEIVDQVWTEGQKLQEFEILAEEPSDGVGPRAFSVKIKTTKINANVKYYVVGKDPLWIYGERDYKKLSGS